MRCRPTPPLLLAAALGGALLTSAGAAAQDDRDDGTPAEGEESPELRALRLAELEMFGSEQALVEAHVGPRVTIGDPPPAFTSDAPPARAESASGGRDLAWLRGLSLPDIPVRWHDRVVRYLEFYRNDRRGRNIMRAWLERRARWGEMVRAELRDMGLPEDLLYVAMVESGFDPSARSYASAVGMWQFIQRTGEEYGLEVSHWVDERRDPVQATRAGARYLADLHERFGSWELAFAAYNMGYGALLRAMRKYNTNDYWVLSRLEAGLPFETTIYVAKIVACAIVGHNPERFGFELDDPPEPVRFDTVTVPGGTMLRRVARAAGADMEQMRELNPSLKRGRIPPGGEREVRIPHGTREQFARSWTRRRPGRPAHRSYVVRFGESLDDIADRFRTDEDDLRALNELGEDERLGPGHTILVPAVEPREDDGGDDEETPVVAVPAEDFAYPDRRRVFYRVGGDDGIADIARFFSVAVDELRRWNNVDPTAALQPGMILQLFVPPEVDLSQAVVLSEDDVRVLVVGSEEFFDHHEGQQGRVRFRYTVQPGDTLTQIARRFDLSVGSVARINRFSRNATLRVGQEIIVYADRRQAPRHALAEAGAEAESETESEAEAEAETEAESEAESESETESGDGAETDSETESGAESESEGGSGA